MRNFNPTENPETEARDPDAVTAFDHDGPPTHEEVQEAFPELGGDRTAPAPKSPKKGKRGAAKKAGKRAAKAEKPAKAPRAKRTPKPKAEPKVWAPGMRGVRKDGKPRKRPRTNEPKSEATRKFGKRVKMLREAKGLTQKELADKAGISQPGLANIEMGVATCGPRTFPGIAKVLGIPASDAPASERKPRDPNAPKRTRKVKSEKASKPAKKVAERPAKKAKKSAKKKVAK